MGLFDWIKRGEPQFNVATVTDRGLVRPENQDAFLCDEAHGVFAVADGMGGGDGGALASRWVVDALSIAAEIFPATALPERNAVVDEALQSANRRIRAYAREKNYNMMGSTVSAAMFDTDAFKLQIVNAGDSRVYRWRGKKLEQLTRDHTVGNELSRMVPGSERAGGGFSSRQNPLTHILTRAIGTELKARPDFRELVFQRGDRYLLCTDGVHDMLSDSEIAELAGARGTPSVIASRFASAIRAAGACDNFTVVLLVVE